MEDKILTLQEVAEFLRVDEATVYRLARKRRIPASKVGRQWRFKSRLITEWLQENQNTD